MKTKHEAEKISLMCGMIGDVAYSCGIECQLDYDNIKEIIKGFYDGKDISINVHMDSVSSAFRDVIKGLANS